MNDSAFDQLFLVSVVTPLFNKVNFIEQCISSVLAQSYANWEMIIIDDCSCDGSYEIAQKYSKVDPRIRVERMVVNSGAGVARNRAISIAKGQFIAFLDADDVWHCNKLKIQLTEMIVRNAAFSHTSYGYLHKKGYIMSKILRVSSRPVTYVDLLKRTEISCLTAMYDVRKIGKVYMPDLPRKQDYATWLDILSRGHSSHPVDKVLAWYRQVPGSNSSNKLSLIVNHYIFLRKLQKLNILNSIRYTTLWIVNGLLRYYI